MNDLNLENLSLEDLTMQDVEELMKGMMESGELADLKIDPELQNMLFPNGITPETAEENFEMMKQQMLQLNKEMEAFKENPQNIRSGAVDDFQTVATKFAKVFFIEKDFNSNEEYMDYVKKSFSESELNNMAKMLSGLEGKLAGSGTLTDAVGGLQSLIEGLGSKTDN